MSTHSLKVGVAVSIKETSAYFTVCHHASPQTGMADERLVRLGMQN